MSSGIFYQVRFKPACSATETSLNLETLDIASTHIILSSQRTTTVLIRLRGCTGWSAPLLFLYGIRHIFAWPGPNIFMLYLKYSFVEMHCFSLHSNLVPTGSQTNPFVVNHRILDMQGCYLNIFQQLILSQDSDYRSISNITMRAWVNVEHWKTLGANVQWSQNCYIILLP